MYADTYRPLIDKLLRSGLSQEHAEELGDRLHHRSVAAKQLLFEQEASHPDVIYILSGYIQLYTTDEQGEVSVRALAGPGDFVTCVEALLYDRPARYTAEAITDAHIAVVDRHLQAIIRGKLEWYLMMQDFILRRVLQLAREKDDMLPLRATDRYLSFRERYPHFVDHIPAGIIANYLGVRPQSLSRIKQSLK